jgi:Glycosyl hydrolase family 12
MTLLLGAKRTLTPSPLGLQARCVVELLTIGLALSTAAASTACAPADDDDDDVGVGVGSSPTSESSTITSATTAATVPTQADMTGGEVGGPAPTEVPPAASSTAPTVAEPGGPSPLGSGVMTGTGQAMSRYPEGNVTRDGKNYFFMGNGWGPGYGAQNITWSGTSFTIVSMDGEVGPNYEPAGYPAVFCGQYSKTSQECGLPASIANLTQLRTGWSWAANGNTSDYNASYDIWLGENGHFASYFMVWLRDPPGQQPAGYPEHRAVTVANVPGVWDIWTGEVNSRPIVNYVAPEGQDVPQLEFDVLDFLKDATSRGITVQGTEINAVAVGFEVWSGPIANLESVDFYIDPK